MRKIAVGIVLVGVCLILVAVVAIRLVAGLFTGSTSSGALSVAPMAPGIGKANMYSRTTSGMTADVAPAMMPETAVAVPASPRMTVRDSTLSVAVSDVSSAISGIEAIATGKSGFLVESSMSSPEGAASGSITVRVPSSARTDAIREIKALGIKTISESVTGTDVTDQYADVKSRLDVLNRTKAKFEKIQESAVTVSDLLNVQQQLLNVQSQIDDLKGQQEYLEKNAQLSRIAVYLSTDEYALPYAPSGVWRPQVVFKSAVRALVGTVRGLADAAIWLAVFSPVWLLPPVIIVLALRRRKTAGK